MTLAFAILLGALVGVAYAEGQGSGPALGKWQDNANEVSKEATISKNSSGSLTIGINANGQNPGSPGSPESNDGPIIESPRGVGNASGPGWSVPPTRWVLSPPTGGADTFGSGPVSRETLPDGTVVQFGGRSIGGWSFPTPPTPGRTTAFAPVGPVPHIDPWTLAVSAEHEAPPPPVTLKANPDPGVVAIPAWFWIQGYDGRVITHSKTQHASHTECRLLNGVPDCHSVDDSVTVDVRLTPTNYKWDFGDGRSGSVQTYSPDKGLGRPYTDAVQASPVQWSYEFDSRDFASGFPVKLTITFAGMFQANGSGWQGLPNIDDNWTTGLVMRQVQTLNSVPPRLRGGSHLH